MSLTFVVFHVSRVHAYFPTICACHRLLWSLILSVCVCIYSQTSHLSVLPGLARPGGVLTVKFCSDINLETFSILNEVLKLGSFENICWENLFYWENLEHFYFFFSDLGKILLGKFVMVF